MSEPDTQFLTERRHASRLIARFTAPARDADRIGQPRIEEPIRWPSPTEAPTGCEEFDRARQLLTEFRDEEALDYFELASGRATDAAVRASSNTRTKASAGARPRIASPGKKTPHRLRRYGVLAGLAAGASLGGLLVATAPDAVPALPLAALITTLFLAARARRRVPGPVPASVPVPRTAPGAEDRGSSLPAGGT